MFTNFSNYVIILKLSFWVNLWFFGLVILAMRLQFIKLKRAVQRQKKIDSIQLSKQFEMNYTQVCRKFAHYKNVTFDFPYVHFLIKNDALPLLTFNSANTDQLLLLQKDHLQITCDLTSFRQHLLFIKATRKYSANFYNVELPEKIGLSLWQFSKGKVPTAFPVFVKRQIIAGNIHIWNMESETCETEMMNSEIKTIKGSYISQHERYCCSGIEFYKYSSCLY